VSGKTSRRRGSSRFTEREQVERPGPKVPPVPLPDGFLLEPHRLKLLQDGGRPTIAFPVDELPPLRTGSLYRIDPELVIYVRSYWETTTHLLAVYEVHRSEQTVRHDEPEIQRKATRQEEPAHPEAEPLRKEEATAMARKTREEEIVSLEEGESEIETTLEKLEASSTGTVAFRLRRSLDDLKGRREKLEKANRGDEKGA
jgi:hypothetical protein